MAAPIMPIIAMVPSLRLVSFSSRLTVITPSVPAANAARAAREQATRRIPGRDMFVLYDTHGVPPERASEPTQMYAVAFGYVVSAPDAAVAFSVSTLASATLVRSSDLRTMS